MRNKKPNFRVKHPYQNLINSIFMGLILLLSSILSVFLIKPNTNSIGFVDAYGGNGTEERPYLIYNLNDLKNVNTFSTRAKVASLSPRHFKLMADVDATSLNNVVSKEFQGIFDGNDKNLKVEYNLFNEIEEGSTIQNLNIDVNSRIAENTGYLANINYGTISNVSLISTNPKFYGEENAVLYNKILENNTKIENLRKTNGLIVEAEENNSEETSDNSENSDNISNETNQKINKVSSEQIDYVAYKESLLFPEKLTESNNSVEYFINLTEDEVFASKNEIINNPNILSSSDGNVSFVSENLVYVISEDNLISFDELEFEVKQENYVNRIDFLNNEIARKDLTDEQRYEYIVEFYNLQNSYEEYYTEYCNRLNGNNNAIFSNGVDLEMSNLEGEVNILSQQLQDNSFSSPLVIYNASTGVIEKTSVGNDSEMDTQSDSNTSVKVSSGVYAEHSYGTNTSSSSSIGGITSTNSGLIIECINKNNVTCTGSSGSRYAAGICLTNTGNIVDCYSGKASNGTKRTVSVTNSSYLGDAGGIVRINSGTIRRTINFGDVKARYGNNASARTSVGSGGNGGLGTDQIGSGLIGRGGSRGTYGRNGYYGYSGGSAGAISVDNSGTITGCYNYGYIESGSGGRGLRLCQTSPGISYSDACRELFSWLGNRISCRDGKAYFLCCGDQRNHGIAGAATDWTSKNFLRPQAFQWNVYEQSEISWRWQLQKPAGCDEFIIETSTVRNASSLREKQEEAGEKKK